MIYNSILRYFSGDVRVLVKEGFPSLLLRRCKEQGIELRFVVLRSEEAEANIKQRDLKKLLTISRDLGMRVEILYQKGLPQFLTRYRRRIGIPIGVFLGAVLLVILSSFLWSVDIDGAVQIDKEGLYAYLNQNHIKTGVFLCEIDVNQIEQLLESYDARIQKATVNLIGCKLYVTVHERKLPPQINKIHCCYDLIAKKDGEIIKADITSGKSSVKKGDVVLKGDLLAAGCVPLSEGTILYTQADGIVQARTHNGISCSVTRKMEVFDLKPYRINKSIILFGIEFPFRTNTEANSDYLLNDRFYLYNRETVFPLGTHTQTRFKKEKMVLGISANQAELICASDLALKGYEKLCRCVVLNKMESFRTELLYSLEADFVCLEEIGEQKYLFPIPDNYDALEKEKKPR